MVECPPAEEASRRPLPVRPVEEPTPALPTLRIITCQLRRDGLLVVSAPQLGVTLDTRG